jgi:hypothetical protein
VTYLGLSALQSPKKITVILDRILSPFTNHSLDIIQKGANRYNELKDAVKFLCSITFYTLSMQWINVKFRILSVICGAHNSICERNERLLSVTKPFVGFS